MQRLESFIWELAARQHGVVARDQLLEAGFSGSQIDRCVRLKLLRPVHRGVYLVGHEGGLARETAAILACRPGALLSHLTAARLWRLPVPAGDGVDVTVVGRSRRQLNSIRVHFLDALPGRELRRHDGLPITSPSLTLLDLAGGLEGEKLAAALNEARVQRLVTDQQLRATLDAHPRRTGAGRLREHLGSERGPKITRSEAERRALAVMRRHGIEPDESDVEIGPYRVDFIFRRERLVVEIDGYRYHGTPKRFREDRHRTAYLSARGMQVFPLTWHDLGAGATRSMELLQATLEERRRLLPS